MAEIQIPGTTVRYDVDTGKCRFWNGGNCPIHGISCQGCNDGEVFRNYQQLMSQERHDKSCGNGEDLEPTDHKAMLKCPECGGSILIKK